MRKQGIQYEDWFKKADLDPLELALLMAETAPHLELGKDILAYAEAGERDLEFVEKYSDKAQQWGFYEKFRRARREIYISLLQGSLAE